MKKFAILALVLTIVAALAFVHPSQAQPGPGSGPRSGSDANPLAAERRLKRGGGLVVEAVLDASEGATIRTIVGQLGEAPDAEKAALMKKLELAVSNQFGRDMEYRESELTKLEERLNKLRQQLERRRRAKNEIIELQIKVLVNEAEGLGFGGNSSASESWYELDPHGHSPASKSWRIEDPFQPVDRGP
jgi:hypothetical protein